MKVATLSLEITSHCHLLIENTSSGTCTCRSSRTLTWHDSRQLSLASRKLTCCCSVGRMSPPPASTWQRHTPQVPPPPHADGSITPLLDRVLSRVPPASVSIAPCSSPLMVILTLRCGRSRASATSRATVSNPITAGNTTMLPNTCNMLSLPVSPRPAYSWMPENAMKPTDIKPVNNIVIPNPRNAGGTLE